MDRIGKLREIVQKRMDRVNDMQFGLSRLESIQYSTEEQTLKSVLDEIDEIIEKNPVYRNPIPTVDLVIHVPGRGIVLVKRKNDPIGWALPGGFVEEGESYEHAAIREAKEETGLTVKLEKQFYTYSDPKRDPRRHIATTVYLAKAFNQEPKGADDAAEARLFMADQIPWGELVFDHRQILEDVINYWTGNEPRIRPEIVMSREFNGK